MHYYNQFPFLSVIKVKYNAQHYLNTSSCTSLLFRIWRLATPKASPRLSIFLQEKCFTYRYSTHTNGTLTTHSINQITSIFDRTFSLAYLLNVAFVA